MLWKLVKLLKILYISDLWLSNLIHRILLLSIYLYCYYSIGKGMMVYRNWINFPKLKFVNIGISSKLRHFSFRALIIHHVTVFDKYHSRSCQHTHIVVVMQLRIVIISIKMEGEENLDDRYAE